LSCAAKNVKKIINFVTVQKEKRKMKSNFLYGLVISDYNGHYI